MNVKNPSEPVFEESFDTSFFIRSFSFRDFLTSFSMALCMMAIWKLLGFYAEYDWVRENSVFLERLSVCTLGVLTHAFYKLEHRRSNNFIGRNFHDYISIFVLFLLTRIYHFIFGNGIILDADPVDVILTVLLVAMVTAAFELGVVVLKRISRLLGWRVI